jgi:hypothetical protein
MERHDLTGESLIANEFPHLGAGEVFLPIVRYPMGAPPDQKMETLRRALPGGGEPITFDAPVTLTVMQQWIIPPLAEGGSRFTVRPSSSVLHIQSELSTDVESAGALAVVDIMLEMVESYRLWIINVYML